MLFKTSNHSINVDFTADKLTPFGGLVAFAAFLEELGVVEKLVATCPVTRTSNNATPIRDIIIGFMLTCILDGKRFHDIRFIQGDEVLKEVFKIEKCIPSDDTVRRFFQTIDPDAGREWMHEAYSIIYDNLPQFATIDWDSTVLTKYGKQDGVEVGYNPTKPGRGSFHPLFASIADTRLVLVVENRPGKSHTASGYTDLFEDLLKNMTHKPYLSRGDIGFGNDALMTWHEKSPHAPNYLFKLKLTSNVKRLIASVKDEEWEGKENLGCVQLCEKRIQLHGWEKERRVVLSRRLIEKKSPEQLNTLFGKAKYENAVYITSLSTGQTAKWQLMELYNKRGDCENIFDELKNQWGLDGFVAKDRNITDMASKLNILSYNLWSMFVRVFDYTKHSEARNSRKNFLMFTGKLINHGNQKTIKIAVADRIIDKVKEGYQRLLDWISSTAPQLNLKTKSKAYFTALLPES